MSMCVMSPCAMPRPPRRATPRRCGIDCAQRTTGPRHEIRPARQPFLRGAAPMERSRRAATASCTSRYCAARCIWPRRSLPEGRCRRSQGTSTATNPLRSRSIVMPVSTPQPRASGVAASKASRVRQRMPDSGWVGVQPVSDWIARRAAPTTMPRPPAPGCGGSSAMDTSAVPSSTGGTSGAVLTAVSPRSPSMNSSRRGGRSGASRMATTAAPVSMAAALPRLCECRTTTAPASRATCWVLSSEPSSTTSTRSTFGIARAERTVAAIRRDSSLAGITTATRCRERPVRAVVVGASSGAGCCGWGRRGLRGAVASARAGRSSTDRSSVLSSASPVTRISLSIRPGPARRPGPDTRTLHTTVTRAARRRHQRVRRAPGAGDGAGRPRRDPGVRRGRPAAASAERDLPGDDAGAGAAGVRVERLGVGQRGGEPRRELGDGRLDVLGLAATGQLPHRDDEAVGPEVADELGAVEAGLAAAVQAREAVDDLLLVVRLRPAQVLAGAHADPVRGVDGGELGGVDDARVGLLDGGLQVRRHLGVGGDPVGEALLDRDLEGHSEVEHVLQARAGAGQAGVLHGRAGLGVERLEQRGGEVAARVAGAAHHLQREQHDAVRAVQRGPAVGQHGGDRDVACAVLGVRAGGRGGGGHELAQGDPVGLAGEALEGAQHEVDGGRGHAPRLPGRDAPPPWSAGRPLDQPRDRLRWQDRAMDPRAGTPAQPSDLVDVEAMLAAYHDRRPDLEDPAQRVVFGTSGHRGSSLDGAFNEAHIVAITAAIVEYRRSQGTDGPLFIGRDTHGLSEPAWRTALEVLAAAGVEVRVDARDSWTPTPAVSHAILLHNGAATSEGVRASGPGLADGIVVTPSHNPPQDGGFKYNPPHGGPAGSEATTWIADRANELLTSGVTEIPRASEDGMGGEAVGRYDFLGNYVDDLENVIDIA